MKLRIWRGFTSVHHTNSLALTRFMWLSGGASSHDSVPAYFDRLCYIVRLASLFRAIGSFGDTNGSLFSWRTTIHTTSCRTTQIHICSSYWLPSTHPICGYQEGRPLTISTPNGITPVLCYIVRAATLFRLLGSSGDTEGSLIQRWTALHTTSRRTPLSYLELLLFTKQARSYWPTFSNVRWW